MTSCNNDGKQHTTPCADCPFRRTVEKGALGGSPVQTYVGQSAIPMMQIPCHSCIDYDDPNWKAKASVPGGVSQCAGAAIFRSNIGMESVNDRIVSLPKDTDNVFASYNEFVAHHSDLDVADVNITQDMIDHCVQRELHRSGVVVSLVPKGKP